MLQRYHIFPFYEILDQNWLVFWSIIVKKKSTLASQFFGAFPSDLIPNATEDNVNFFIHTYYITGISTANCCKLYQRIPGKFLSFCVFIMAVNVCFYIFLMILHSRNIFFRSF